MRSAQSASERQCDENSLGNASELGDYPPASFVESPKRGGGRKVLLASFGTRTKYARPVQNYSFRLWFEMCFPTISAMGVTQKEVGRANPWQDPARSRVHRTSAQDDARRHPTFDDSRRTRLEIHAHNKERKHSANNRPGTARRSVR